MLQQLTIVRRRAYSAIIVNKSVANDDNDAIEINSFRISLIAPLVGDPYSTGMVVTDAVDGKGSSVTSFVSTDGDRAVAAIYIARILK
jgi:hypothetical protein